MPPERDETLLDRLTSALLICGLIAASGLDAPSEAAAAPSCYSAFVTGYVRSEYGPYTYDGTHIMTAEPIAAASWDLPINSMVSVEGLGTYRIADRGLLGSAGWIDVAVWSRAEAYAITGNKVICVTPPGG